MKEILYFTAPWCKSCKNLKPHIEKVSSDGKVQVQTVDISVDEKTAHEYDVMQLPTLIFIQDDAIISRRSGFSDDVVRELYLFSS